MICTIQTNATGAILSQLSIEVDIISEYCNSIALFVLLLKPIVLYNMDYFLWKLLR